MCAQRTRARRLQTSHPFWPHNRTMTLADRIALRLAAAGITPDDPGLQQIRDWNRGAALLAELADAGYRKRPAGYKV